MTQLEFANAVGISRSIVVSIELQKGTSLAVLEQIARTFNVSVSDLTHTDPIVPKSLINSIGEGLDHEREFNELPPYLQAYGKSIIVLLTRHFIDRAIEEVRANAKAEADKEVNRLKREAAQMYYDFSEAVKVSDLPLESKGTLNHQIQAIVQSIM
jgi:transcriptional regulator with XRE-family HTH domain